MTQERKDQLIEEMLSWISDHIPNDQDLFLTLYENIGITKEELHELDIECLDGFFPNEDI